MAKKTTDEPETTEKPKRPMRAIFRVASKIDAMLEELSPDDARRVMWVVCDLYGLWPKNTLTEAKQLGVDNLFTPATAG